MSKRKGNESRGGVMGATFHMWGEEAGPPTCHVCGAFLVAPPSSPISPVFDACPLEDAREVCPACGRPKQDP
jgi:hypothetical protein